MALLFSCARDATSQAWTIGFESDDQRRDTLRIELSIREGGCAESGVTVFEAAFTRDDPAPDPGELPAGVYALEVVAFDSTCAPFLERCQELQLPSADGIEVMLSRDDRTDATSECEPAFCDDTGLCSDPLDQVRLISPPPGRAFGSVHAPATLRAELLWQGGAPRYEVELARGCDGYEACEWTRHETDAPRFVALDLPVSTVAPVGARYWWRVRGCDDERCGAFSAAWPFFLGRAPNDFNGDGFADIAIGDSSRGEVSIYPGGADGAGDARRVSVDLESFGAALVAADMNGDGFGDLLVDAPSAAMSVLMYGSAEGLRGGSCDGDGVRCVSGPAPRQSAYRLFWAGDVDLDGHQDIARAAPEPAVFHGGPEEWRTLPFTEPRPLDHLVPVGDWNRDGVVDLFAFESDKHWFISWDGQWQVVLQEKFDNAAYSPFVTSAIDVDLDGSFDLVVGREERIAVVSQATQEEARLQLDIDAPGVPQFLASAGQVADGTWRAIATSTSNELIILRPDSAVEMQLDEVVLISDVDSVQGAASTYDVDGDGNHDLLVRFEGHALLLRSDEGRFSDEEGLPLHPMQRMDPAEPSPTFATAVDSSGH